MANKKQLIDADVVRHKINAFAASVVYRGNAEMFNGKDTCNPHEYTRGYERGILDAQKIVCGQDPVDAVEVVHGRWNTTCLTGGFAEEWGYVCSVCGCTVSDESGLGEYQGNNQQLNYCPNCGAKMDGGNEDG